jgi:CDP-paratose 2-epimerase
MARYLITGGLGFIGFNAALRCARQGHSAVLFDDLSRRTSLRNLDALRKLAPENVSFVRGDVRRPDALRRLIRRHGGFDRVLHLAGQVAVTESWKDPRADFEINALGTLRLVEALRRESPRSLLLFSSTNKVYGGLGWARLERRPTRWALSRPSRGIAEDAPLEYDSPYAHSKGTAELFLLEAARAHGLRAAVLRQSCVYGPWQWGEESQGWVSWFLRAAAQNERIRIFGDGLQTRDLLHVDDLLDLYDAAWKARSRLRGQVFNVGGGVDRTLSPRELLDWVGARLARSLSPRREPARLGDQKAYVSDVGKARRELGWKPRVSVEQGLERQLEWARR